MTKILEGKYKAGIVTIQKPNAAGQIVEQEITDINIIGTVSITSDTNGYVILCNDCSLFIPENPAAATTELLKVLIAAINQLTLSIDVNLPLIANGIAAAGGSYTPILLTPIIQPVVQAATQLQQTSNLTPNTPGPEIPLPDNIEQLNSAQIEILIEQQNDKINLLNKTLGIATAKIDELLAPIMGIINLINSFASAGIDTAKSALQSAKDQKKKLEKKKEEKTEEEQGIK